MECNKANIKARNEFQMDLKFMQSRVRNKKACPNCQQGGGWWAYENMKIYEKQKEKKKTATHTHTYIGTMISGL